MSTRLSRPLVLLLALGFVLGAGGTSVAQAQVTADDLNLLNWRWVGPVNVLGPDLRVRRAPRANHDLLCPGGQRRGVEDRGRRHALRAHLRQVRQHEHGLPGHRRVRSQDPATWARASRCTPARAPTATASGNRPTPARPGRASGSPRASSSTRSRSIRRTPTSSTSPPRASSTTTRRTASAASTRRPTAARPGSGGGPLADRGVADFVVDPREFRRHHRPGLQALPPEPGPISTARPGNNLYKIDRRRQDLEDADGGPAHDHRGRARPAWPSSARTPTIVYARIDEEVNLGLAERDASPTSARPAASAEGCSPRTSPSTPGRPLRSIPRSPSRRPSSRPRGRGRGRAGQEAQRVRRGQGVPDEVRDRPGHASTRPPARPTPRTRT